MEYLYKCEKCGKVYTNENEAWKCEDGHAQIDNWNRYMPYLASFTKWKTGNVLPSIIALASDKLFTAEGTEEPHYGLYELKRELTKDEMAELEQKFKADHPEENEEES